MESPNVIELKEDALSSLGEIRKWTLFLAILGFIFIGFMVFAGFSFGMMYSMLGSEFGELPLPGFVFGIFYLAVAALYFFPIYYLYKFSVNTKRALDKLDEDDMANALYFLRSHYRFIGILTVVIIALYILMFIAFIPLGLMSGMM